MGLAPHNLSCCVLSLSEVSTNSSIKYLSSGQIFTHRQKHQNWPLVGGCSDHNIAGLAEQAELHYTSNIVGK